MKKGEEIFEENREKSLNFNMQNLNNPLYKNGINKYTIRKKFLTKMPKQQDLLTRSHGASR